jgi:hypothetical protein
MEPNRHWPADWDALDVRVQRTFTWQGRWRHPHGFSEGTYVHIPYDTLYLLKRYKPNVIVSGELGWRTIQALVYRYMFPESRLLVRATLSAITEQGRGRPREWLRHRLLACADAVMVNGRSGADYIRRFKVPEEKLFFTPSTTDLSSFSSLPLDKSEESSYRLLYVGRLVELKGVMPFMRTLSRWAISHPKTRIQLWLLGDGPLRPGIKQMELPPNVAVSFLGNVAYEDLPKIYVQAGILAFPTLADEWGMVVNEALAAGLPILGSTYSQAVEELVQDGVNGWTFRPDRPEEMFTALDRALTTPEPSLVKMRLAARNTVKRLTPDFVADRIVEAICSVCS